jgi:hypothetical protein
MVKLELRTLCKSLQTVKLELLFGYRLIQPFKLKLFLSFLSANKHVDEVLVPLLYFSGFHHHGTRHPFCFSIQRMGAN